MPIEEKDVGDDTSGKGTGETSSNTVSSSSGTGIGHMYKIYEKLNLADDKTTLEPEFRELLAAVHRSEKEKRLASQFITRFMEYFPLHHHDAVDAMLDLCEHDDVSMRRQVVRDLITICKKVSTFVPKIADVFSQLMQTNDNVEYATLQSSLISLYHIDGQAAVVGMFAQIRGGVPIVKDRCIKFIATKLKDLSPEITTLEFERTFFSEVKRVMRTVTRPQFISLLTSLKETRFFRQLNGQQAMVDLLADQLNMDTDFDSGSVEETYRLALILKHVLPIFSSQVSPSRFVVYLCTKVIPQLRNKLTADSAFKINHEIIRLTAEITAGLRQMDDKDVLNCLESMHNELVDSMPAPIPGSTEHPDFQFSRLEIYLYIFHKLSHYNKEYLTLDEDRLKNFRIRLQYLARGAQTFMKKLREDLEQKKGEDLKTEETRIKIISLKVTANLSAMIRDMFRMPPIFKIHIIFSWNPLSSSARSGVAVKRPLARPATAPSGKGERERELYQPPGGKFSSRAGAYSSPVRGPSWQGNRGNRGYLRGNRRMGGRPNTAKY